MGYPVPGDSLDSLIGRLRGHLARGGRVFLLYDPRMTVLFHAGSAGGEGQDRRERILAFFRDHFRQTPCPTIGDVTPRNVMLIELTNRE